MITLSENNGELLVVFLSMVARLMLGNERWMMFEMLSAKRFRIRFPQSCLFLFFFDDLVLAMCVENLAKKFSQGAMQRILCLRIAEREGPMAQKVLTTWTKFRELFPRQRGSL